MKTVALALVGVVLIGVSVYYYLQERRPASRYVLLENEETGGNLTIEVVETSDYQWIAPGRKQEVWRVRVGYERGPFLLGGHRWEHADDGPSEQGSGRELNLGFMNRRGAE